ncbi:NADP-dependent malic enzyme-like [Lineus longissimus]|uniref:NADP-dependent malic enzyme-like n=1 Tax=Lineus longissimus TaxID=88925 RepID=UPI002B4DE0C4
MSTILSRVSCSGRGAFGVLRVSKWAACSSSANRVRSSHSHFGHGGTGGKDKGSRMSLLDNEEDFAGHKLEDAGDDYGHEAVNNTRIRGVDILRDPHLNKGMAFSLRERQVMGVHALLPPREFTQEQQVQRVMASYDACDSDLEKYINLVGLRERNEKLFFRVITRHIDEMLPIIYTPTVGLACQKYGMIFRKPRGLFLTIHDRGHLYELLCNWPEKDVRVIVVTDGERILGLGDLGVCGMGIPVGKLTLCTALAGIHPHQCLPIVLDVGTNNEQYLNDKFYVGLPHKRITGQEYDDFIDEFMEAVVKKYGQDTLIQFEDFANHNAFRFLDKYRDKYTFFNDDIQGTASVTVAGLLSCMKITKKKLSDNTFFFLGAGEAACGIASLLTMAMVRTDGLTKEEAASRVWMMDIDGLLVKNRPKGGITGEKALFAKDLPPMENLAEVIKKIKPNAIIGASGVGKAFTPEIIRDMATFNERPIILALSNPTSKAECTAVDAYTHTDGRAIFASGSPFGPVTLNGKTYYPGQGNNAYIFPGVALGTICCGIRHIPDDMFLIASETLADMVTPADLEAGRIYPSMKSILRISRSIAARIAVWAYKNGMAAEYPEPEDKLEFIKSQVYSTRYESFIPEIYDWPVFE